MVDLVMPERGDSLVEAFNMWKECGEEAACCDFALAVYPPALFVGHLLLLPCSRAIRQSPYVGIVIVLGGVRQTDPSYSCQNMTLTISV